MNLWVICEKMVEEYDFMNLIMYPNLKSRREFVHDAWLIAMALETEELKMAISIDPYFYLTRNDLLYLLNANDDKMITNIME